MLAENCKPLEKLLSVCEMLYENEDPTFADWPGMGGWSGAEEPPEVDGMTCNKSQVIQSLYKWTGTSPKT